MFYYQEKYHLSLPSYGIEIPILNTKVEKFFNFLKTEFNSEIILPPKLKLELSASELAKLAHEKQFIDRIFSDPEPEIIKTFELINSAGEYHRYNPTETTKKLSGLVEAYTTQTYGTIEASINALKNGFGYNLGGGHHHAMVAEGRGFCLMNDILIAAKYIQKFHNVNNIWVIDIDAHKGDGTAQMCKDDPSITTLSIHMAKGWPLDSEKFDSDGDMNPWFIESDIEIGVNEKQNSQYLNLLSNGLCQLKKNFPAPDLAIVVQGSDPYEKDELESASLLKLTADEMLQRDLMVYNFLKDSKIPQTYLMSGGYGQFAHEPYIQFIKNIKDDLL
jgi:acetoin utilization deacetylase AcuC-like enzyme